MAEREVGDNLNRDTNLRKERHQGPSGSLNLSDYKLHEHAEETETHNEDAADNVIPVRRWIRGHYTKLTNFNEVTCNHCNDKYIIDIRHLNILHFHLTVIHPDKLTEEEKKEVKFHWVWDYFTLKGDIRATCNICKKIISSKNVSHLTRHLKNVHKIFGPSSDSAINNEGSLQNDANRDISLKTEKRLEGPSNSSNLSNYQLQECIEETGTLNEDASDNVIPVRRWIREHYTKLTNINEATCNHCSNKFIISTRLESLHKHLVKAHSDKLTEEEKKEVKFHWAWDYYTLKDDVRATCNICKKIIYYCKNVSTLKQHLRKVHKIFGPSPDSAINNESNLQSDANMDISLKKEKHLEDPSNSSNLSNQLKECIEETGTLNEDAADNVIPVRRWIRGHYTKLTNINEATCNHCNDKYIIHIRHLQILHLHLRAIHPDKLTEEEKKEVKFHWAWDYFTLKDDVRATCNICKKIIKCKDVSQLRQHLSHIHKIFGPSPDSAINNESSLQSDANRDISLKKEKLQEGPSNSSNLSNYPLQECTEETGTLNEDAAI